MLRRPPVVWLFVFLVVAWAAETAWAQPPQGERRPGGFGFGGFSIGGGPGGPGGGLAEAMLLNNEQVQKEIELLPEQLADLNKLRETQQAQMRETFGGLRDLSEEERRAKFEELRPKMEAAQKENRAKINEILLPHQQDRLKQIALQLRGAAAVEDSETAATLKITDEQKEKIKSTREAQREKVTALFREGQGGEGNREAMREKFQNLRKENDEQLLGILTAEQREQLEKMQGEKFEIDLSQFNRGPGGPGGRRPGGDQPGGNRRPDGDQPTPNKDA